MSTVRGLLKTMDQDRLFETTPEATVHEALKEMRAKKIGSLLVVFAGQLAGIVSERDYAWKVELEGRTAKGTLVKEIMTPRADLVTVTPAATLEEAMELMDMHHIRHIPVLEKGELLGLISIRDVIAGIVRHHEFLEQEMRSYISRPG